MLTDAAKREREALIEEGRVLRLRVRALEKDAAAKQKHEDNAAEIRKVIYGLAAPDVKAPAWTNKIAKHPVDTTFSVPVALWSDWHWGERVSLTEMGGLNEFDRTIAKKRLKRLVATTCSLAHEHMGKIEFPGIVVCLGGDMISGNIHEELRETNEGTIQQTMIELQDELCGALTVMADRFGKVFVPCVVGNHGRMKMKPHAKRKTFESYEWNLYQQLERYFRSDKRLRFMIPDSNDAPFSVLGHRFLLTHGDAMGVKGGDGIIGAIGPITRGAMKLGKREAQIGRDFDTLLIGHWHTYTPRGEGSAAVVNGALKGYDEYARNILAVPFSRPSQALFFVHAKHGITAQWQVYLDEQPATIDKDWVRFEQR